MSALTPRPKARRERKAAERRRAERERARAAAIAARTGAPAPAPPPRAPAPRGPAGAPYVAGPPLFGSMTRVSGDVTPTRTGPVGALIDRGERLVWRWRETARREWGPTASNIAVIAGTILALAGVMVGLGVGGPVLGHESRPVVILAGLAALGGGGMWAARGWRGAAGRGRWVTVLIAGALATTFTAGVVSDPVVIDGRVYLSSSTEARSYRLLSQIRVDLVTLAKMDELLTFDAAQSGAHFQRFAPTQVTAVELVDRYVLLSESPDALPDPRFADVVSQTTAAAYWAAKALETKVASIEADSAKTQADLATNRATYAEAVVGAGQTLSNLAVELGMPLTQMGPVE